MEVIEFGLKQRDETNPYLVPAVIYGKEMETISIALDRKEFKQVLKKNGKNVIMNCTLPDGKIIPTVIKEIQQDVVSFEPFHVDFMAIRKDQTITITVPIRLQNKEKCAGVKNGGKLQFVLFKVNISGKPEDLPRELTLDVTDLDVGHIIYTRDLPLSNGVTMASPLNLKVVGFYSRNVSADDGTATEPVPGQETPPQTTSTDEAKAE
ncbi:MAG: 50S ribosomal protein L25 [Caldisericia bacterium]|nr:50S ribosomal protein L25 [Caldisericia bacterium]